MNNWKTTLIGAVGGALIAVQPLLATNTVDWKAILTGFVVALFGAFAKDFNVTGGTTQAVIPPK